MKQADLDRVVARVTGETVSTIKRLGFLLAEPAGDHDTEVDDVLAIDWDELEVERQEQNRWRPDNEPATA